MFCFRQFEDWIFQPPLNLLMFKFLTGKHSKALQGSWNLRSLLTRDIELSWRLTDVVGAWLPEGKGENHSKLFRWCSLSALSTSRAPSFSFWGWAKLWQPRWFSHLQLFLMKVTSSQPQPHLGVAYWQPFLDCHSQLLILLHETVRRMINARLQVWLSEPEGEKERERKRDYKDLI